VSSTHREPLSTGSTKPRFVDGQLQVRHAASVVPGFEVMVICQHLRDDGDAHEDGWIVLARFRTWVGIPAWRSSRRGLALSRIDGRPVSPIPLYARGGAPRDHGRHHPSDGPMR
jgi:hypothetical protein